MKKKFALLALLILVIAAACGGNGDAQAPATADTPTPDSPVTIRIGASPVPHTIILEYIADELAEQGVLLDIVEFADFVMVNPALHEGQIDANYFQHGPFLANWIADSGNELTIITDVHIEPMSIYSETLTDLSQVPEGGTVALPNDAVNGGRALAVLESSGLIGLTEGVGIRATVRDIIYNPLNLSFMELEAPIVPVALGDVDIAVINTNFALGVGLNPMRDALYMENPDSPFANILVTRPENADNEAIRILAATLTTERVREFILERFEGAVVPAF
ncbi:MAG: MetQ/NlpA family ABC transporter substrate-binding protein [Defluviitaleaceae bacterium]|nr:MetQ/NlpA family ABC transporter substrate-binding protein [Defluviitaleaceae bacterium]